MRKAYLLALIAMLSLTACEKWLDIDAVGVIPEDEALSTKEGLVALLNDAYGQTGDYKGGFAQGLAEVMADQVERPNNDDFDEAYRHNTLFFNGTVGNFYAQPYTAIWRVNKVLEKIGDFDFTETERNRISGEAYFLRAMAHFDIMNLFAQPYGYTSDNSHSGIVYRTNTNSSLYPRPSVASNYSSVIADLNQAIALLPDAQDPIYATKDAARALLAKVYFQMGDYTNAADLAGQVIDNGRYSLGTSTDRFLKDAWADETVFGFVSYVLQANADFKGGFLRGTFQEDSVNQNPLTRPTREFYDIYVGDTTDQRMERFLLLDAGVDGSERVTCRKFQETYFNVSILHLTDLKLMRAEALAEIGSDLATAAMDVNDVRERAYGSTANNISTGAGATEIITAARYEREIEMFGEGDRLFQLKRRGAIEGEFINIRGSDWNCNGMILQFPISEKSDVFDLNPSGGCN